MSERASESMGTGSVPDRRRLALFFAGFAVLALILAGVVSYFASSSPDGLDSATTQGCQVVRTETGERLDGNCVAKHATEHGRDSGPLAGYAVGGDRRFTGIAGVVGVLATLAVGFGVFTLLRKRSRSGS